MLKPIAIIAMLGGLWAERAAADPLFCSPERKEICNYNKPCEIVPAGEFLVVIDEATNSYTRCDKPDRTTCSTYTMVKSGDHKGYMTFEMSSRAASAKSGRPEIGQRPSA